jgi:hypothetical protein
LLILLLARGEVEATRRAERASARAGANASVPRLPPPPRVPAPQPRAERRIPNSHQILLPKQSTLLLNKEYFVVTFASAADAFHTQNCKQMTESRLSSAPISKVTGAYCARTCLGKNTSAPCIVFVCFRKSHYREKMQFVSRKAARGRRGGPRRK